MAHYAQLDQNNVVIQVISIADKDNLDSNGCESEEKGKSFCSSLIGSGTWVKTSYNGNMRKKFAGIGDTYNKELDAFISPQTHPDQILNKVTCSWEFPISMPKDGNYYNWNTSTKNWEKIETPSMPLSAASVEVVPPFINPNATTLTCRVPGSTPA